jgi:hypothetical protein
MNDCSMLPDTAAILASKLRALGFSPGAPLCVPPAIVGLDRKCYRHCPQCHRRSREYRPYHRGNDYRAISVCLACAFAEEV